VLLEGGRVAVDGPTDEVLERYVALLEGKAAPVRGTDHLAEVAAGTTGPVTGGTATSPAAGDGPTSTSREDDDA
jgi:hypothetical protein